MTATEVAMSYSQGSTYQRSGYAAYLERVARIPSRPHWSTLGGSAFHNWAEAYNLNAHGLDIPVHTPAEALRAAVDDALKRADGLYTEDQIRASKSGKGITKAAWPNGADRKWIEHHLPIWIDSFKRWQNAIPWDLALLPDAETGVVTPAVEVGFEFMVAPNVRMRGSVDAVYQDRTTGRYILVDYKAGARQPSSPQQLAVYRTALADQYDIQADEGTYFMVREASTTPVYDLRKYTPEFLRWFYATAADRKEARDFLPDPDHMPGMCGFSETFCWYCGGELADTIYQPWEVEDFDNLPAGFPYKSGVKPW